MAERRGKESEPEPTGSSVTSVAQVVDYEALMKSLNDLLSDDENDVTLDCSKNLKDDSSSSFDSLDEEVKNARKPNQSNEAERQNPKEKKDDIVEDYFDQFLDASLLKKKEVKKENDEIEKIQETSVILTTTSESDCSTFLSSSVFEEEDKEALLLREQGLRPELSAKGWVPLPPEDIPPAPEGFIELAPNRIPTVGDAVREGTIRSCKGGGVVSPSEFYLIWSQDHPDLMEELIQEMSTSYQRKMREGVPGPAKIVLEGGRMELEKGTVVAFVNRDDTTRNIAEILRGIIIEKTPEQETLDLMCNGALYKVFCVDLGRYQNVHLWDMRFLYKDFFERAGLAIRCRLHLPPSCEKYHYKKWDKRVICFLHRAIYQRIMKVKFVRKVEVDGEPVWEVSILDTDAEEQIFKDYKHIHVEILLLKMMKKFKKMDKAAKKGGGGFKGD